jgi:ornithine carbamoyltransferase
MKHFLQLSDHPAEALKHVMEVALRLKKQHRATGRNEPLLAGRVVATIFEKPSLRTRVSFSVATAHLGGTALELRQDEVGIDTREPAKDVARVLSGMCDAIVIRTFGQDKVERLAEFGSVPVINALTDLCHPCQAMADVMTLLEHFKEVQGKTVAFIGDGNNVARSLAVACGKWGMKFVLAAPKGYELPETDVRRLEGQVPGLVVRQTHDPKEAATGADCLYTDTWVSMGQEAEKAKRVKEFAGFTVDEALLGMASPGAVVMHCLPAYRGYEISDGAMEHERSLVFQQAENRLHVQKAILAVLLGGA